MNTITFQYDYAVGAEELDGFSEQGLWDAADEAAHKFRLRLVQFWSTATPKRREEAAVNKATLGESPSRD